MKVGSQITLWRLGCSALVLIGLVVWSGCGPGLETTEQAVSLPLLEEDPRETGDVDARWAQWRGPNSSGIAAGVSPAIEFSNQRGFRWKVPVPGSGNSSPVVWDDSILLTSAIDETDPPMLAVLCFDRNDGRLRWRADAGQAVEPTHNKNGYASASVATYGQRIFAFFGATGLFCYDFDGNQLWQTELGDLTHQWGTAASPVLYGDTVIQLCDSSGESYVAAFDQATGHKVWRTDRPSFGCWSTPVLVEVDVDGRKQTELVVNGTGADDAAERLVIAYDPVNGEELWRVAGTNEYVTPTPVVNDGLVITASGRDGAITAIRPGGRGDVANSHVVWRRRRGGPYIPSTLAYRNRLFVLGDQGRLTCYNPGNGDEIWSAKLRGTYTASLVAADGRIWALSERGTVSIFAAADAFELLAQNEIGARCLATPAIVDGELFLRTEDELYCIPPSETAKAKTPDRTPQPAADDPMSDPEPSGTPEPRPAPEPRGTPEPVSDSPVASDPTVWVDEGEPKPSADAWPLFRCNRQATGVAIGKLPEKLELLWTFTAEDAFVTAAAIVDSTVYIGSYDGKFYAIDLVTGQKRWDFDTHLGFSASPAVRGGRVYVGDCDGWFRCFDAKSGEEQWHFETGSEINSSANFHRDNVVFGSQDGYLYCLKDDDGSLVWQYESEDMIQCSPSVVGDRTFVAGCDGRLHIIDLLEGRQVADVDLQAPTLCTPALVGNMVYVATTGNALFAIDWQKAKVVWEYTDFGPASEFHSSAAVTPEVVVIGSRDKRLHAVKRSDGTPLWTFITRRQIDGSPVVVDDRVIVGSGDGRIYMVDLATGEELWKFEAGGSIDASPAVAAGRLVIGTNDGDLYCFGSKEDSSP